MPISEYLKNLRARIGHDMLLMPSITAIVVNDRGEILLQKSRDTNDWRLIGGIIDPGEQPADCAVREVKEEAGIDVIVERIIGVHARPPVTYPNDDKVNFVSTSFLCCAVSGEPRVCDDESLDMKYFSPQDLPKLNALDRHLIELALSNDPRADFQPATKHGQRE
jgi:8-oxo-dGTP diphosphatase